MAHSSALVTFELKRTYVQVRFSICKLKICKHILVKPFGNCPFSGLNAFQNQTPLLQKQLRKSILTSIGKETRRIKLCRCLFTLNTSSLQLLAFSLKTTSLSGPLSPLGCLRLKLDLHLLQCRSLWGISHLLETNKQLFSYTNQIIKGEGIHNESTHVINNC